MTYKNIRRATFLARPNRFIAHVELDGAQVVCHVKNTGRCRELLVPGATVLLEPAANPQRKTPYDLVAVWKGRRLINMDAAAPNRVFAQWLETARPIPGLSLVRPEYTYGDSRFDFYLEAPNRRTLVEVKGVTLEQDGVVRFPDAPTLRGVKHLRGLTASLQTGYEAWAVFIIQMQDVAYFAPNWQTHPDFGRALVEAQAAGVHLLALDCTVTEDAITARSLVPIRLDT